MHFKAYPIHKLFDESFVWTYFVDGLLYLNLHPSDDLLIDVKKLLNVIPVHELIPLLLQGFTFSFAFCLNFHLVVYTPSTCGIKIILFVLIFTWTIIVDIEAVRWVYEVVVVPFLAFQHYFLCVVSMLLFFLWSALLQVVLYLLSDWTDRLNVLYSIVESFACLAAEIFIEFVR